MSLLDKLARFFLWLLSRCIPFIHRRYAAVSLMFFFPFLDPSSFLRQPISIDGTGTNCMAAFSYTIHRRVHGRNARCLLIEAMMLLPIMKDIFSTRRVEGGGRGKKMKSISSKPLCCSTSRIYNPQPVPTPTYWYCQQYVPTTATPHMHPTFSFTVLKFCIPIMIFLFFACAHKGAGASR